MAHARRERRSDHLYRMECRGCHAVQIPELGGGTREMVEEEGNCVLYCPKCDERTVHVDVTGGDDA